MIGPNDKGVIPVSWIRCHALTLANVRIAMVSDFYLDYVGGMQSSMLEQRAALEAAGHEVLLISAVRRAGGEGAASTAGDGLEIRPAYTVPGVILPVDGAPAEADRRAARVLRRHSGRRGAPADRVRARACGDDCGAGGGLPGRAHDPHVLLAVDGRGGSRDPADPAAGALQHHRRTLSEAALHRAADRQPAAQPHARAGAGAWTPSSRPPPTRPPTCAAGVTVPIVVVPNPIARSPGPPRCSPRSRPGKPRLLWVARCEPEKRPLVFAEAAIDALDRAQSSRWTSSATAHNSVRCAR